MLRLVFPSGGSGFLCHRKQVSPHFYLTIKPNREMIKSKQVEKIRKALHDKVNEIHEQLDRQLDDLVRRFHEDKHVRRLMVDILHDKEGGVCGGCGATFPARNMELDHTVPKSSGESYCIDNRQVLCGACNKEKGKKPMGEFLKKKGGHSNKKTNIRKAGMKDWEFVESIVLENKPNPMSVSEVVAVCLKRKLWRAAAGKFLSSLPPAFRLH